MTDHPFRVRLRTERDIVRLINGAVEGPGEPLHGLSKGAIVRWMENGPLAGTTSRRSIASRLNALGRKLKLASGSSHRGSRLDTEAVQVEDEVQAIIEDLRRRKPSG